MDFIDTADGSFTLYSSQYEQSYHSPGDGALKETLNKHVLPALKHHQGKRSLKILDICFGLGYNSFATIATLKSQNFQGDCHIYSPELDTSLIESLIEFDYPDALGVTKQMLESLIQKGYWEEEHYSIELLLGDARQQTPKLKKGSLDIIYQDAFSPKVNPTLWTKEWFELLFGLGNEALILTTYSTAASTRMGLYENGFVIYEYQAPDTRKSLLASKVALKDMVPLDMALKIERNPTAKALRDAEVMDA